MFFYKIQYGLHHEKTCFCTSENKGADQLCDRSTTYIVHSLYFINSKLEASSHKPQSHIHGFGPGRATVHPDLASR